MHMHARSMTGFGRRVATAVAVLVTVGLLGALPAQATVSTPTAGQTVAGKVTLSETGATGGSSATCTGRYSRIEVHRLDGAGTAVQRVFTETHAETGAWSTVWDTAGLPNGSYRVLSYNRNASGTCTLAAEAISSDFKVTLENSVTAVATLPATHVTGEPLAITVHATNAGRDDAEGIAEPAGGRTVTVTIPGVDPFSVVTDANGDGTINASLPDLPAGTVVVTTSVAGDPGYVVGKDTTRSLQLTSRTSKVTWTGDTEGLTTAPLTLGARITDATAGSARNGNPIAGAPATISFDGTTYNLTTDADGRISQTVNPGAPERQGPAEARWTGTSAVAGSSTTAQILVKDQAITNPDQGNGVLGGLTRLVGGVVRAPSQVGQVVTKTLNNLLPAENPGEPLNNLLESVGLDPIPVEPVDAIVEGTLGPVVDTVAELGDKVDPLLEGTLDVLGDVPLVGDITDTIRYDFHTTYVRPDGTSVTGSYRALMLVPTPIDLTGDTVPDVLANLTLVHTPGAPKIAGMSVTPVIDVIKLPGAPAVLPMSIQAVIAGDGLVSLGGGRVRIGFDARTTSVPERATVGLGFASGGFDLDVTTEGAQDLAVVGAIEGGALDLGFGSPSDPADLGAGETRFGINLSPAPEHTHIGLGIGGGSAGLGVNFATSAPSDIGLSFAQDSGGSELTAIKANFETVLGNLSLVLNAGSSSGGAVPELGLQLLSDNGLDKVFVQARTYADSKITDDLRLSLTDVPTSITFGVGDDGSLALGASAPVGVMEAGFASGGEIATLDEPAYLYLLSNDDIESVGIRLLGVTSLHASLTDNVGLDLEMAPTKLRAVMDTPESSLDAAIYDAPAQFSLGLAADGAFVIQGSSPIDLITLKLTDSSGALLGADSINVRIEDIPKLLAITLVGGAISFDTGGNAVGLLELVVGNVPAFTPGEDSLIAAFNADGSAALGVRVHGLRTITAGLDLANPEFVLDTTAQAILNLDLSADGLNVGGRIDRLQPNMTFGVASDADGNLVGLKYKADQASNSIFFDVPGLATFTVFDPLPKEFTLLSPPAPAPLSIFGSETFTLQLNASFDGVAANINTMRLRHMDFASATPNDPSGTVDPATLQAFYLNTTEFGPNCPVSGCVYPLGDTTRTLAAFNAGASTPTATGALVLGPIDAGGFPATVTLTPRGLGATNATVTMSVNTSTISASHVNTDGVLNCTGTNNSNGTDMKTVVTVIIIPITVQMRNALCGGSTARADLAIASVVAPANVTAGSDAVQTVTVRNDGPNDAANVKVVGTYGDALGDPTATCPGGVVSPASGGSISCTWSGATTRNSTRAMTLTFPTTVATPQDTSVTVDYLASSTTVGNTATASATSTVHDNVANLSIVDKTGPSAAVGGEGDIVHSAAVRNNGPSAAANLQLAATSSDALGAPDAVCSDDGVLSGTTCTWATVPAGEQRSIGLTYQVPLTAPTGELTVTYHGSSDTPGTSADATSTTQVATAVADLVLTTDAPARLVPGEELVHTLTVRNDGPSAAQSVRILGDYGSDLGTPTVTCSDGGTATDYPELLRARCLWLGATAKDAEHTMTLSWTIAADTPLGTTRSVSYRATSDTTGADDTATVSTLIQEPTLLEFTATSGPAIWAVSSSTSTNNNLIHSVTAQNTGGAAATDVEIVASLPADGVIANPAVTCTGGVSTVVNDPEVPNDTQIRCVWSGTTGPNVNRTMSLNWSRANMTDARTAASPADPVVAVGFTLSSSETGEVDTAATSTEVRANVANITMSTGGTGATLLTNAALSVTGTATRALPIPATGVGNATVVVTATPDPALGAPTSSSCGSGASPATPQPGTDPGTYTCSWPAGTATTGRVLTLGWTAAAVAAAGPGTYTTTFTSSSDVDGAWASASRTTTVSLAAADMSITGLIAPETVGAGETLVQSIDARNVGTVPASNMRIQAAFPADLGAPTVTCVGTGTATATASSTAAQCQWASTSAANANRRMNLTWNIGAEQAPLSFTVDYTATSDTAGTPATASGTTSVAPAAEAAAASTTTIPDAASPEYVVAAAVVQSALDQAPTPAPAPAPAKTCLSLLGIKLVCK
jgi:hypothetical protein